MRASDTRSFDQVRYGAYICLSVPAASQAAASADVPALAAPQTDRGSVNRERTRHAGHA
jgi:hypothetical protein